VEPVEKKALQKSPSRQKRAKKPGRKTPESSRTENKKKKAAKPYLEADERDCMILVSILTYGKEKGHVEWVQITQKDLLWWLRIRHGTDMTRPTLVRRLRKLEEKDFIVRKTLVKGEGKNKVEKRSVYRLKRKAYQRIAALGIEIGKALIEGSSSREYVDEQSRNLVKGKRRLYNPLLRLLVLGFRIAYWSENATFTKFEETRILEKKRYGWKSKGNRSSSDKAASKNDVQKTSCNGRGRSGASCNDSDLPP